MINTKIKSKIYFSHVWIYIISIRAHPPWELQQNDIHFVMLEICLIDDGKFLALHQMYIGAKT